MGNNCCSVSNCENVNNSLLDGHGLSGRQQDEQEDDDITYIKSPITKPLPEINGNKYFTNYFHHKNALYTYDENMRRYSKRNFNELDGLTTIVINKDLYVVDEELPLLAKYSNIQRSTLEEITPLANLLYRKSGFKLANFLDRFIFLTGGSIDGNFASSVEWYDIAKDQWKSTSPMRTARKLHSSCALKDFIYVVGGASAYKYPEYTYINSIERLNARKVTDG